MGWFDSIVDEVRLDMIGLRSQALFGVIAIEVSNLG
jgi:hypothetical protein